MAAKNTLQKLLDLAGQFVTTHKGEWGHAEWEELLRSASALGIEMHDEDKRNLGNILEASKYFYCKAPGAPPRKTPARKKAPAKKAG